MNKQLFGLNSVLGALLVVAVAAGVQFSVAQDGAHSYQELSFTVQEDAIEGPDSVEAGFYTLALSDQSGLQIDISIGRLEDGASVEAVLEAVEAVNQSFMGQGNPGEAMAQVDSVVNLVGGQSIPPDAVLELTPGEYVILSVGVTEEGEAHTDLGLYTTFTVTESAAEADAPQADLTVDMLDFAFSIPEEVAAGEQTWQVVNVGEQIHHMVLMRVKEGRSMEEAMDFLETEEGEPPVDEVGYVTLLDTDERNFLTFDLTPGAYIALCFMPDYETGQPHVALGMIDTFTVAGE